jgi:hypothetical protein
MPQFGIIPAGTYQNYHVDTMNMLNGNDIIKIPLFSLPQRGKLSLSFSAVSNTYSKCILRYVWKLSR